MKFLVEYELKNNEVFPGNGGIVGKNGKLLGIADVYLDRFKLLKRNNEEYSYDDVFQVLYSYSTIVNKHVKWNNDGTVEAVEYDFEFDKYSKLMKLETEFANYIDMKYPQVIKTSDIIDTNYWLNYFELNNINVSTYKQVAYAKIKEVKSGNKSIVDAVKELKEEIQGLQELVFADEALKQIIKSYIRQIWYIEVKSKYKELHERIKAAKDKKILDEVDIESFKIPLNV